MESAAGETPSARGEGGANGERYCERRRRPAARSTSPSTRDADPLAGTSPCPGPSGITDPSALSTETTRPSIHERAAVVMWAGVVCMMFFHLGLLAMDRHKQPQPYQAIAVAGEIPATTAIELEAYKDRLAAVLVTVEEMDQAVGLAATQLGACYVEARR